MHAQRIILGTALLMLTGCQAIGGEGMPTLTRTGEVKDVIIRENVDPATLTVTAGDEIRWINKRQAAVRVIFLTPMTENLTCQRNFGGVLGFGTKRNQYSAKLRPNKTASVCFRESGEVKYVVRAESTDFSGEQNLAGTISIGHQDQARRPGSPDTSAQLAAADTDRRRLSKDLAAAEGKVADRDATVAGLQTRLDQSLAAQSEKDQSLSDLSSRFAAADRDRQRLSFPQDEVSFL
jgi:plastocyanin